MNPTPNKAITPEEWAEAEVRQANEIAANPQLRAMAEASAYTVAEQSDLADAEAALLDRQAEYESAFVALNEARTVGFLDRETADLDLLERDLAEAKLVADNARKRRNLVRRRIEAARMARRQAAKVEHAPKKTTPASRAEWWSSIRRLGYRKDAA